MLAHRRGRNRSGSVLVLAVFLMVALFGMLAFAVDLGYIQVVRSQMQRSADAAALAAAWDLIDEDMLAGGGNPYALEVAALGTAAQYAGLNQVAGTTPTLAGSDVEVGYLSSPVGPTTEMSFVDPSQFNAVRVVVRRTTEQNGPIPLFFVRALGINSWDGQAEATAMFLNDLNGFTTPSSGGDLGILPFALDLVTWNDRMAGIGTDNWTWNPGTASVTPGADGVLEVNLYPQGTGSPGNRGTVDIGSSNNSTADIVRQILDGISPADLAYHGGSLEFDANGEMFLNADTGISAGFKDDLEAIKGEPRIIPIFNDLNGNGNNAMYTIVQFVGIRIMDVKLTGQMSGKRVIIQPAFVSSQGMIPPAGNGPKSTFINSPVWLVR